MELEILLIDNRYNILQTLNNMFFGVNIILATISILVLTILESPYDLFFIFFAALLIISMLIQDYIMQEVGKRLDFESDIQLYQKTGKIKFELFENIIKSLNREKYHICRGLDCEGNISEWSIFRRDMPIDDYFKEENEPILTEKDGLLSLIFFVKGEEKNAKSFKRNKKTNGKRAKTILD